MYQNATLFFRISQNQEVLNGADSPSQALAQHVGFTGKSIVSTDSAHDLEVTPPKIATRNRESQVVGIAPMPYPLCDPRVRVGNLPAAIEDFRTVLCTAIALPPAHTRQSNR